MVSRESRRNILFVVLRRWRRRTDEKRMEEQSLRGISWYVLGCEVSTMMFQYDEGSEILINSLLEWI